MLGQSAKLPRTRARGHDHGAGAQLGLVLEADAGHPVGLDQELAHAHARADLAAAAIDRGQQRGGQRPRVHRVVVGGRERQADGGRERRLDAAGPAGRQPLDGQSVLAAEVGLALERLGLVAVAGHQQGAGAAVAGIAATELGQFVHPGGVPGGGRQVELQQRALAEGGLGDGRQHPGGDVRGSAGQVAPVEDERAQAPRGRPLCDGQPGDASPDHDYVGRMVDRSGH